METPCWCPVWGTPTWRPEINENFWNSVLLRERLLFPRELVYVHIITSRNALTVQTAKNHKKRPLFQTRQLCHGAVLRSRTAEIWKVQDAVFWTQRMLPSWKLVKKYILVVPSPGDNKNLAGLASFDFRILWRYVKTSNMCERHNNKLANC